MPVFPSLQAAHCLSPSKWVQVEPSFSAQAIDFVGFLVADQMWCPGEDSNLHELLHWYLKPARLPVPPPGLRCLGSARRRNLRTRPTLVNRARDRKSTRLNSSH